jgi:CheY-like chemotaxis protein
MPRLDGVGATRRIHEQRGPNSRTPVLAFTADAVDMDKLGPLGFAGVVAKPIEPMALIGAIARACAEAEAPDQLANAS